MAARRLFLVRHAQAEELGRNRRVNSIGREKLEPTIQTVKDIFEREEIKRHDVSLVSSDQRRAIDTALFIGDAVSCGKVLITDVNLFQPYEFAFERFYSRLQNQFSSGSDSVVIAAAHREIVEFFPKLLAGKQDGWGKFEYLGRGYGEGYYYDFENKSYEPIPF
tara:strand:- start:3483 stop:3974 length:492 start_codon:yes stop_codon:yes gene_type:complete